MFYINEDFQILKEQIIGKKVKDVCCGCKPLQILFLGGSERRPRLEN